MASGTVSIPGDMVVNGDLRVVGDVSPGVSRTSIAQDELQPFAIPMSQWRVHDAYNTPLPAAASGDDLGCVAGTHGTNCPALKTDDHGGLADDNFYARCEIVIPMEYDDGQTMKLRFHAGMQETLADQSCTLDCDVYSFDKDGTSTVVAVTESAQDINSLTFSDIDFTLGASGLSSGDVLDVKITVAIDDDGNAGDNITAVIGMVQLLCDVRG